VAVIAALTALLCNALLTVSRERRIAWLRALLTLRSTLVSTGVVFRWAVIRSTAHGMVIVRMFHGMVIVRMLAAVLVGADSHDSVTFSCPRRVAAAPPMKAIIERMATVPIWIERRWGWDVVIVVIAGAKVMVVSSEVGGLVWLIRCESLVRGSRARARIVPRQVELDRGDRVEGSFSEHYLLVRQCLNCSLGFRHNGSRICRVRRGANGTCDERDRYE